MEETNEAKNTTTPLVIRVSVKSTPPNNPPDETKLDSATSIILDTFLCGHCQLECVDITEFLGHRLQHTLTCNSYRCELCKTTFVSPKCASDHYLHTHKVDITSYVKGQDDDDDYDDDDTAETEDIQVNIDDDHVDIKDEENQDDKKVLEDSIEHDIQEDKSSDIETVLITETVLIEESASAQTLKFRLHKEEFDGSKFKYARSVFSCIQCNFSAYSLPSLISHVQKNHSDAVNTGEQETSDKDELVMTVGDYYAMNARKKASEQFNQSMKRRQKKQKQDQNKIHVCATCDKVFQRARSLRLHLEIHRTERNYLCDECGKAFKSQIRLNAHRRVHKEKIFSCSQCDFQSSINSSIHVHRQIHRDGCVLCHVCGSAYTDKSTLKKHMQVHSLDRPFGCAFEGCTWRFKTMAMCRAHFRAHTSKGTFKCSICGYVFRHKHHLQRHQTSVHGVNTPPPQIQASPQKQIDTQVQLPVSVHTTGSGNETNIQVVPVQVVVATDMQGTPITYEQPGLVDVNHLILQTSGHTES